MSNQQPSSPVNLFKPSASSTMTGQSVSRETTSSEPIDKTFSRELSKANERNVERPSQQGTERPSERSESTRQSTNRSKHENETRTEQKPTRRSEGSRHTEQRSTKDSEKTAENKSVGKADTPTEVSRKVPETVEQQTADTKTDPVVEQKVSNTQQAKEQALELAVNESSQLNVQQPDEEPVTSSVETPVEPSIVATSEQLSSAENTVDKIIDTDAVKSETVDAALLPGVKAQTSEAEVPTNVSASTLGGTIEVKDGDVAAEKPAVQRLTVGEQLSPTQLAHRQTHLFNNVTSRPSTDAVPAQPPAAVEAVGMEAGNEASRSAKVAVIAAAPLAVTVKDRNANTVVDRSGVADGVTAKPLLMSAITGDSSAEQAAVKNALADDAEAAANLTAKLAARQSDQQSIQNNLAQTRQISQQQVQSLNLLTAAAASEPADRANQSTDNMFLSLPGGIVTAPVVQRLDAGINQTINAPINMPILQNDADKAMAGNIRWMVNEGVKNAVVNVTPSGMGPISVTIGMEKDQMNISIVALQGATREALDSMLPRLREQFAAQGQENVRVDISDGRTEQSDRGYGQQFADEQSGSEQDDRRNVGQLDDNEGDDGSANDLELANSGSQGLITVNENGQIRSRYDAYV